MEIGSGERETWHMLSYNIARKGEETAFSKKE